MAWITISLPSSLTTGDNLQEVPDPVRAEVQHLSVVPLAATEPTDYGDDTVQAKVFLAHGLSAIVGPL